MATRERLAQELRPATRRGRRLDWVPRYDERSRRYAAADVVDLEQLPGKVWAHGAVLDQGAEGACVGFGCVGDVAAEPVPYPQADDALALAWYRGAQRRDNYDDSQAGTSVLAGMLEGRARGAWGSFRWAFTVEELAAAVVTLGPAVIGVSWRDKAYRTDELGVLQASGRLVGGHCLLVLGYLPADLTPELVEQLEELDLLDAVRSVGGDCFVILNSWGPSFGKRGLAVVPGTTMRTWFREGGEFAIPVDRAVPTTAPAPPEPVPAAGPDETQQLRAAQLQERDRIVEGVPAELEQASVTVQARRVVAGGDGDLVRVRSAAGVFTLRASATVKVRRPVA